MFQNARIIASIDFAKSWVFNFLIRFQMFIVFKYPPKNCCVNSCGHLDSQLLALFAEENIQVEGSKGAKETSDTHPDVFHHNIEKVGVWRDICKCNKSISFKVLHNKLNRFCIRAAKMGQKYFFHELLTIQPVAIYKLDSYIKNIFRIKSHIVS